MLHSYGFSPVWILSWILNSIPDLNFLGQLWHSNGFSPVWIILWTMISRLVLNFLGQFVQWNFFSLCLKWVASWFLSWQDWEYISLQNVHLVGFSSELLISCLIRVVWILSCLLKFCEWVNLFAQCLHSKGFSPVWVWILSCVFKLNNEENVLLQDLHSNGFSPVWILSCAWRLPNLAKSWPQVSHEYLLSPLMKTSFLFGFFLLFLSARGKPERFYILLNWNSVEN